MYTGNDTIVPDNWYYQSSEIIDPAVYLIPYTPPIADFDDDHYESGDSMTRQPPYSVARLLQQYETQYPQSYTQLERYRVPRFFARRIFRSVIGYVLRNTSAAAPLPLPVTQYAETLLNKLIKSRPMFQNAFTYFRVPAALSRSILLNLIVFVLSNMTMPQAVSPAVDRVIRVVEGTTNVFRDLAQYKISLNDARTIVGSIADYVIRNPGTASPASGVGGNLSETVDRVIKNTGVYQTLTSKGVPAAKATEIIRTVAYTALREI